MGAAFGVHANLKSHTGAVYTFGKGSMLSMSVKQKVNSRSSTEAEFIAVNDVLSEILWLKRFAEIQTKKEFKTVIFGDNQRSMKEMDGNESSGKRTRNF